MIVNGEPEFLNFCFFIVSKVITMSNEIMLKLKDILKGEYEKEFLIHRILPVLLGVFVTFLAISWIVYPVLFNPVFNDISFLGHPSRNPLGWIFWSIGMTASGILMFPIPPFIGKKLYSGHNIQKIFAVLGTGILYVSLVGMVLVGCIPQYSFINLIFEDIHLFNAILAFGGMYLAIGCWAICLIFDARTRTNKLMIPFTIAGWFTPIGFSISTVFRIQGGYDLREVWILSVSLWEWSLLILGLLCFALVIFMLPDDE